MKIVNNNVIVQEHTTSEYENKDNFKQNELNQPFDELQLFKNVGTTFQLQLSINKQLYENGKISKELYQKVENVLLQRIEPIRKCIGG